MVLSFVQTQKNKSTFRISKKSLLLITFIVIIVLFIFIIKNNVLFGNDKIAYDFITEYIFTFKEPSSVRLVSGRVDNSDVPQAPFLYCGISATNGYGGRTTSYYIFRTYSSRTDMEERPNGSNLEEYTTRDELNLDLINKKIQQFLKTQG